jgi:hypothetical protein
MPTGLTTNAPPRPRRRPTRWVAAGVVLLALAGLGHGIGLGLGAGPAAAIEQPDTIDIDALDMVPVRMWGVSGQQPQNTQTETLDVLVWDFAQSGDRMFVGGAFLNVQEDENATPIPQAFVAAFDIHTGEWVDTWTPQLDRAVYALEVLPNGSLLVGGEFETVNGVTRRGLVALDPITGAIDSSFPGAVDRPWSERRATVRDLQIDADSGRIYVAGSFSHLEGAANSRTQVSKVGRFLDAAGTIDTSWTPPVQGGAIWGIDTDPTRGVVALAGFFTSVGGQAETGHFEVLDDVTGAVAVGRAEIPRNLPGAQPEMFDVTYGDGVLFVIGEQHMMQVIDADTHQMLGYHHTGARNDEFAWSGHFAGGAYQAGERIGDVVFAGCHCTSGTDNHYDSIADRRTTRHNVMAYDAATGAQIEAFDPDLESPRDGFWAAASATNGCLYLGGDFHLGGNKSGKNRWLGGFAKLCPPRPDIDVATIEDQLTMAGDEVSQQVEASATAPGGEPVVLQFEASNLPPGLLIEPTTGMITGTPTRTGSWDVTITVTAADGDANPAWFRLTWSVLGADDPRIRPVADQYVVEYDDVSLQIDATGGGLTYAVTGLPAGLTIDAATGLISGTAVPDGESAVTVTVTDPLDRSDTETFLISIADWPREPALAAHTPGQLGSSSVYAGWQFSVDQVQVIGELGIGDGNRNGVIDNAGATTAGLWDQATRELLATVDIPPSAPVENGFAYAELATPVTVQPGRTYIIAAELSGEPYTQSGGSTTTAPGVTIVGYAIKWGTAQSFPWALGRTTDRYIGPSFRFLGSRPDPGPGDGGPAAGAALVNPGSTWRFDDTGADLGNTWSQPAFDDSGWATGEGPFGFGSDGLATQWTPGFVTYYARTTFEFDGATPPSLTLDLKADDGAIVYLNGVEILRDNLPIGTVTSTTPASTWRAGADETFFTHIVPADALINGTNVLAVEIHNVWSGSADVLFDLQLTGADVAPPPEPEPDLIPVSGSWRHTDADDADGAPPDWPVDLPADAPTASAEFGFGDGDEATLVATGKEAYYFAAEFTVADPADHPELTLGLAADDGAVVYLNGVEVQRVNMPDGPIGPTSRPVTWMAGDDERFKQYTVPGDALVPGTNRMTVEVHNLWPGNSDVTFDLYLR